MSKRFRIGSTVPRRLEELGVSPAAVLREAGLPAGLFGQAKVLVTTGEFFALYRAIARASRDPAVGLKLGTEERLERYDPVCMAALYARSLRDALQRLARYKQLTCPEEIRLEERGGECAVQFAWLLAHEEEPALLVDVCFAWIAAIAGRGSDGRVKPLRVELQRPAAHADRYRDHFGCEVRFDGGRNALVFARADLERPFVTHNADLLAMVAPQLEAELAHAQTALPEQVKAILKRQLAGRRPAIEDAARELGLGARTLQRRLAEEGATFQRLLQEARRELARHYLLHSSLELNQTAYLLGYEDAHSFFRAFHQWEGSSPGHWRAHHRGAGLPVRPVDAPAGRAASTWSDPG